MRDKQSARRFRRALLLYSLILILAGSLALMLLHRYLTIYEATRPSTALAEYRSVLLSAESTPGCREALATLDSRLRPEEESLSLARELLQDARFAESIAASGEDEKLFRVIADGRAVGQLRLLPAGEEQMGLRGWTVDEESYDFSAFLHSCTVTVPPGYRVFLGGHELGPSELVERDLPYETLADAYGVIEGLPRLQRYESGLYWGELPLRILDTQGRELAEDEQNEAYWLNNCGEEDRAAIDDFVEHFLRPYILFTANIDQEDERYFEQLLPLVLPGSPLRQRLQEGNQNNWWSWVRSCELEEYDISGRTNLGDGRFLVDLHYTTRVVAISDPVVESYSLRLILDQNTGKLLASALYNR